MRAACWEAAAGPPVCSRGGVEGPAGSAPSSSGAPITVSAEQTLSWRFIAGPEAGQGSEAEGLEDGRMSSMQLSSCPAGKSLRLVTACTVDSWRAGCWRRPRPHVVRRLATHWIGSHVGTLGGTHLAGAGA